MSIELKQAAQQALEALEAELSEVWTCNSYHPSIYPAINALRTAIQQAESEPVKVAAPHIAMGFGRYEVGSGTYQGTPCIAFGKNGTGKVGELVTMEPRQMSVEETVAVITFANVEGLDVLQEKVDEVRALHFAASSPSPWLQKPNPAPGVPEKRTVDPSGVVESADEGYIAGWNACREAMLAASPDQKGKKNDSPR